MKQPRRPQRSRRDRELLIAVVLLASFCAALAPSRSQAQSSPRFTSLADAVHAGVLAPEVVTELQQNGSVKAILRIDEQLNQRALAEATAVTATVDRLPARVAGEAVPTGLLPDRGTLNRELNVARTAAIAAGGSGVHETTRFVAMPLSALNITSEDGLLRLANAAQTGGIGLNERLTTDLNETLPFIGQPAAVAAGLTGLGTVVGVLDTGVDYRRSAFGPCISPGVPVTCRVGWAQDFAVDDGVLDDPGSLHGTNVSGIVLGVAPSTTLAVGDVFSGSVAFASDVVSGLAWLVGLKSSGVNVVAVNLSLGGTARFTSNCSDNYSFSTLLSFGIQPVVASGNSAFQNGSYFDGISSPACISGAVSVGQQYDHNIGARTWGLGQDQCTDGFTTSNLVVCSSQSAPILTMLAPGTFVTAAGITQSGTSQAAPHVTGAIAGIWSVRRTSAISEIVRQLRCTGYSVGDTRLLPFRYLPTLRLDSFANDDRSLATLTSAPNTLVLQECASTAEVGEPAHGGLPAARSRWYRYAPPGRTGLRILPHAGGRSGVYDLGSNVSVPRFACPPLSPLPCDAYVLTGGTVDFAVDSDSSVDNEMNSNIFFVNLETYELGSDTRSTATPLVPGGFGDSNRGATTEAREPDPSNAGGSASVWYRITSAASGRVSVELNGADAPLRVAVYDVGGAVPRAVSTAGTSAIAGPFSAGSNESFDVQVTSAGSATSQYFLNWSMVAGPTNPNDTWGTALALIGTAAGTQTLDNAAATDDSGLAKNVWTKWIAPSAGTVSFTTKGSNLDTTVNLYRGATPATLLQSVGDLNTTDVGWSTVATTVNTGDTLWLSIGSQNTLTEGSIMVTWNLTARTAAPNTPTITTTPPPAALSAPAATTVPRGPATPAPPQP